MATVERGYMRRATTEKRVVVLSDSMQSQPTFAACDDLLLESLSAVGAPVCRVGPRDELPQLTRGDVCFDTLGVWLSDAHAERLTQMTQHKRTVHFAWIKLLRGERLPQRFSRLPPKRQEAIRRALHVMDHCVVASDALRGWLLAEFPVNCPVQCISGLLPIPQGYLCRDVRQELAAFLASHEKNVCCPGVFEPEYGFDQAADAVDQLRRTHDRDIGLVLAATGPRQNREFRSRVLAGRDWIFCAANLSRPEMLRLMTCCDVVVRCANREHCGLLRIEAVRLGTPVVAVRVCGETRGMRLFDFGSRYQLVVQLRHALLQGKGGLELSRWSDFFTRVAESNAAELKAIALRYLARGRECCQADQGDPL